MSNDSMLWAFAGPGVWIKTYDISLNDKILATTVDIGSLALWDLRTGMCLHVIPIDFDSFAACYYETTSGALCISQDTSPYIYCLATDTTTDLVELPFKYPWETTCPPRDFFIPFEVPPGPLAGYSPRPSYPISSEITKTKIRVFVSVCIDKNGEIKDWEIDQIKPECAGLEKTVGEIITAWRFKPAERDGTPVGVWYTIPLQFEPRDEPRKQQSHSRK